MVVSSKIPFCLSSSDGFSVIIYLFSISLMLFLFLISALKDSNIYDFIEKLENQYDTLLQKEWTGGTDLSGGQWQKIAIARTLFNDNVQAYFFDEPTSAIDIKSERKIFHWLLEENQKMVVYIVHKLEITSLADEILVMQNGKLVEYGSYNELIKKQGLFYDLYLLENS